MDRHSDGLGGLRGGEAGWAALEGKRTRGDGQKYRYRVTLGLRLEGGSWRFTQLHYSVHVADQETSAFDVVGNRRRSSPRFGYG